MLQSCKLITLLIFHTEKGQEKRRLGEGIIGRLFHRELKDHNAEGNLKDQLDNFDDHRYVAFWNGATEFLFAVIFILDKGSECTTKI